MGGERPAGAPSGNLLLDALFGAEVIYAGTEEWAQLAERVQEVAEGSAAAPTRCLRAAPHRSGRWGSSRRTPSCSSQLDESGLRPRHVYHASTSGGTHAGLMAGHALARRGPRPIGFDVGQIVPDARGLVTWLANEAGRLLGADLALGDGRRASRPLAARRRLRRVHAGRDRGDRDCSRGPRACSWTLSTAPRGWRAWWRMPGRAASRARSCSGTRAAARRCSRPGWGERLLASP